jgi:large subunit ribosomal protein L22
MPETTAPETRAVLRYSRVSPSKVRQVLGLIRGVDVDEARDRLRFCERGAAEPVRKLLDSAVANAEHNDNLPPDELYVVRAYADEGPTLKRLRRRARGRGTQILKRTCHVTIVVTRYTDEELEKRRRREETTGGVAERRRRASRRRRVKASAPEVEEHDHDHEEDAELATDEGAPISSTSEASGDDNLEDDNLEDDNVEAAAQEEEKK